MSSRIRMGRSAVRMMPAACTGSSGSKWRWLPGFLNAAMKPAESARAPSCSPGFWFGSASSLPRPNNLNRLSAGSALHLVSRRR